MVSVRFSSKPRNNFPIKKFTLSNNGESAVVRIMDLIVPNCYCYRKGAIRDKSVPQNPSSKHSLCSSSRTFTTHFRREISSTLLDKWIFLHDNLPSQIALSEEGLSPEKSLKLTSYSLQFFLWICHVSETEDLFRNVDDMFDLFHCCVV